MTVANASLNGVLAELTRKKAQKTASEMGDKDTTHPSASAPNSTQDASEGARSAENSSDVKDQQPVSVESTDGPEDRENPSGSMGVDDKKSDEGADMDTGDTSGVSEMAEKDTTHPSKSASALEKAAAALELLTAAIEASDDDGKTADDKAKEADDKAKTDEPEAEKTAEEKLAAYAKELDTDCAEIVENGEKFAEHVLGVLAQHADGEQEKQAADFEKIAQLKFVLKQAMGEDADPAQLDGAAQELAGAGVEPEELQAELMAGDEAGAVDAASEGGDVNIEELAAALEQAGVSPEELEALAAQEELGEDEQGAALDEAMTETGMGAEDIAAAGGEVPEDVVGKAASVKIAADKTAAYTAFKNQLVRELTALKKEAQK